MHSVRRGGVALLCAAIVTFIIASGAFAKTKLVVWGGVPVENGPADLIAAFNRLNPDIEAVYVRFVNDDVGNTKLDTALLSGEQIDVYFSYGVPWMTKRIEAGMAEPLDPYIRRDFPIAVHLVSTDIWTYQGKIYSLPTADEFMYYMANKDRLDAAGLAVPSAWTIDEFRSYLKKLTARNGAKITYGAFGWPPLARMFLGPDYWYKEDGRESNFDHPAFRKEYELAYTLMHVDQTAFPWREVLARGLRAYAQDVFMREEVAMIWSAPWHLRYVRNLKDYPHDWKATFLPPPTEAPGQRYYNPGAMNNWIMINSRSKNKEAAWRFVKFWITEGSYYMLVGGKLPVWKGVDPERVISGLLGPDRERLFDVQAFRRIAFDPTRRYAVDTITTAMPEINTILTEELDRYLLGEVSLEKFLKTLKERADQAIRFAR